MYSLFQIDKWKRADGGTERIALNGIAFKQRDLDLCRQLDQDSLKGIVERQAWYLEVWDSNPGSGSNFSLYIWKRLLQRHSHSKEKNQKKNFTSAD